MQDLELIDKLQQIDFIYDEIKVSSGEIIAKIKSEYIEYADIQDLLTIDVPFYISMNNKVLVFKRKNKRDDDN